MVGLGLALSACAPPTLIRDPSGHVVFNEGDLRHATGLPYLCYDYEAYGKSLSACFLQQDSCEKSMKKMGDVHSAIVKSSACAPSDEVDCFAHYRQLMSLAGSSWRGNVQCARTRDQCEVQRPVAVQENSAPVDVKTGEGRESVTITILPLNEMNLSACMHFGKSYQPKL